MALPEESTATENHELALRRPGIRPVTTSWSAVVYASPDFDGDGMASRLPSYLHPVAGQRREPVAVQGAQQRAQQGPDPLSVLQASRL
jgi:hypothetical protein